MSVRRIVALIALGLFFAAIPASAQESSWGVSDGLVALGRLELAIAGIVAPGLKVRASGGMAFPGMHTFSIAAVYLIGAK